MKKITQLVLQQAPQYKSNPHIEVFCRVERSIDPMNYLRSLGLLKDYYIPSIQGESSLPDDIAPFADILLSKGDTSREPGYAEMLFFVVKEAATSNDLIELIKLSDKQIFTSDVDLYHLFVHLALPDSSFKAISDVARQVLNISSTIKSNAQLVQAISEHSPLIQNGSVALNLTPEQHIQVFKYKAAKSTTFIDVISHSDFIKAFRYIDDQNLVPTQVATDKAENSSLLLKFITGKVCYLDAFPSDFNVLALIPGPIQSASTEEFFNSISIEELESFLIRGKIPFHADLSTAVKYLVDKNCFFKPEFDSVELKVIPDTLTVSQALTLQATQYDCTTFSRIEGFSLALPQYSNSDYDDLIKNLEILIPNPTIIKKSAYTTRNAKLNYIADLIYQLYTAEMEQLIRPIFNKVFRGKKIPLIPVTTNSNKNLSQALSTCQALPVDKISEMLDGVVLNSATRLQMNLALPAAELFLRYWQRDSSNSIGVNTKYFIISVCYALYLTLHTRDVFTWWEAKLQTLASSNFIISNLITVSHWRIEFLFPDFLLHYNEKDKLNSNTNSKDPNCTKNDSGILV